MSNWNGLGRTNYFRVKDRAAFDEMLEVYGLEPILLSENKDGAVALSGYGYTDDGDVPSWVEHPASGEESEFWDVIQPHIADGEVLVYQTAGHEKARYASGSAMAMMNDGQAIHITIDEIYARAKDHFGIDPTQAAY